MKIFVGDVKMHDNDWQFRGNIEHKKFDTISAMLDWLFSTNDYKKFTEIIERITWTWNDEKNRVSELLIANITSTDIDKIIAFMNLRKYPKYASTAEVILGTLSPTLPQQNELIKFLIRNQFNAYRYLSTHRMTDEQHAIVIAAIKEKFMKKALPVFLGQEPAVPTRAGDHIGINDFPRLKFFYDKSMLYANRAAWIRFIDSSKSKTRANNVKLFRLKYDPTPEEETILKDGIYEYRF